MAKVYFGTAGWSYKDWQGIVYPKGEKDPLSYVIEYLDCVEINTTFYNIPKKEYVENWAEKAKNKDFRFIVKANKIFTHENSFDNNDVDNFLKAIAPLEKNTPVLFQFPFYFKYNVNAIKKLEKISLSFNDKVKILEVRSDTFDNPEIINKIHKLGFSFCLPDYPVAKSSFNNQSISNGKTGYFRLHGRNYEKWFKKNKELKAHEKYDYLYSYKEEKELIEKIKNIEKDTEVMYVIANNHYRGKAFINALSLKSKLLNEKVQIPDLLLNEYPQYFSIKEKADYELF